jgi:thiosulfate dehydrogenase
MQDIVSYLAFLSTDVPTGAHVRGEGIPRLARLAADARRGGTLFVSNCVRCHGASGQGAAVPRLAGDGAPSLFAPALWGPRSFSIGAGMARLERAAAFIRTAMPYDQPGTLTDQQAYDLAAFVLSHARPDYPGKDHDWPEGGAPEDVPYTTRGHRVLHPPPVIRRIGDAGNMTVPERRKRVGRT